MTTAEELRKAADARMMACTCSLPNQDLPCFRCTIYGAAAQIEAAQALAEVVRDWGAWPGHKFPGLREALAAFEPNDKGDGDDDDDTSREDAELEFFGRF